MSIRKKNVWWIGVALLVVIIGIWGCNLFDKDRDSPTGPGDAVSLMNGYTSDSGGTLYSAYNKQGSQFCTTLPKGCWLITYYTANGKNTQYAQANLTGTKLVTIGGMIGSNAGPAESVWAAKITQAGGCVAGTNAVQYMGSGKPTRTYTPPSTGAPMSIINANGVPGIEGNKCPESGGASSVAAALQTFQVVTVALVD